MSTESAEEIYLDKDLRKQLQQGYVDATEAEFKRYMRGALDYIYGRPYDNERVEKGDMLYDIGHHHATVASEIKEEEEATTYKPFQRGWVNRYWEK